MIILFLILQFVNVLYQNILSLSDILPFFYWSLAILWIISQILMRWFWTISIFLTALIEKWISIVLSASFQKYYVPPIWRPGFYSFYWLCLQWKFYINTDAIPLLLSGWSLSCGHNGVKMKELYITARVSYKEYIKDYGIKCDRLYIS